MIKKYQVYFYIGELTNIFKQPFEIGQLIINNKRFILIDSLTRKQKEIKNIFSISLDTIVTSNIIRIDTMNEVIYISASSKIFPKSYNSFGQITNNITTNKIYKEMK